MKGSAGIEPQSVGVAPEVNLSHYSQHSTTTQPASGTRDAGDAGVELGNSTSQRVLIRAASSSVSPVCKSTTSMQSIQHGGRDRSYQLHFPASVCENQSARSKGVPLLIYLHCYGCSCQNSDGWTRQAQERGVVLAQPCGTVAKGLPSWNAGACCGGAVTEKIDDVGFVEAVTRDVIARFLKAATGSSSVTIDQGAIYLTGFSNGGYLTSILARRSTLFRKVAPVAGYEYNESETVHDAAVLSSVPIMIHHGQRDQHVRAAGCCDKVRCCCGITSGDTCVSVTDFFEKWGRINGCNMSSHLSSHLSSHRPISLLLAPVNTHKTHTHTLSPSAAVVCTTHPGCRSPTILCMHTGRQHGDMMGGGPDKAVESIARFFFD